MSNKKNKNKISIKKIALHFVAIIATAVLLVFLTLAFLNVYTRHGQSVDVPRVEGLQVTEARTILRAKGLNISVLDSIYVRDAVPGAIIDQKPNANNNVKIGRTVYVTVFARNPRQAVVPNVVDYSVRHARATLNSLGFNQIAIEEVPSEHAGIVLGVQYRGRTLTVGESVPAGSPLRLIVGRGRAGELPPPSELPETPTNVEVAPQTQGIDNTFN